MICIHCGAQVYVDKGVLVDNSGGDVCGWDGGNEPHEVADENEIVTLAILDITGITDDVPNMPDFL